MHYLHTLTSTQNSSTKVTHQIIDQLNRVLSSVKVFDKTVFLKNPSVALAQIHLSTERLRIWKAVGTFGAVVGSVIFMSIAGQQFSLVVAALIILLAAIVGWSIPEFVIGDFVKSRQFALYQAVPNFLEQFYMLCSSAGFESFVQALKQIAPNFPGIFGDELRRLQTLSTYCTQTQLLDRLIIICPHPLLKEFRLSVSVSTQYGSSLTDKTKQLVETAWKLREQQTKDMANKTSGVLLGPLLIFHLPALLIIFLIPFLFVLQKGI